MKESENYLKDYLVKNERRGDNYIEVKNDLSRSIILEDQASKYRISKRHSANKERISSHHKNITIDKFDVKNIILLIYFKMKQNILGNAKKRIYLKDLHYLLNFIKKEELK